MITGALVLSCPVEFGIYEIEVPGDIVNVYEDYGTLYALYVDYGEGTYKYTIYIVPAEYNFGNDNDEAYFLTSFPYNDTRYCVWARMED
jgi:hypothetical protein